MSRVGCLVPSFITKIHNLFTYTIRDILEFHNNLQIQIPNVVMDKEIIVVTGHKGSFAEITPTHKCCCFYQAGIFRITSYHYTGPGVESCVGTTTVSALFSLRYCCRRRIINGIVQGVIIYIVLFY